MRAIETRGARRPPILDRPRVAWEADAAGRRRAVGAREVALLRPVRVAVVLDALAYLGFVVTTLVPGPPGFALFLSWPLAAVWALADVAAWEGTAGGLEARSAIGAFFGLVTGGLLLRDGLAIAVRTGRVPEGHPALVAWALAALLVMAFGSVACLVVLRRPRRPPVEAPPDAGTRVGPGPLPPAAEAEAAPSRPPRVPPARSPSRAARFVAAFGVLWMGGGVVEALRGNFWFGLVEVAVGAGWLLCRDTLLDRRTDRRLVRTDRASLLPALLVPLGGLAVLVRAAWLLGLL